MSGAEVIPFRDEEPIRLPPHNVEAEQALLGALLVQNKVYDLVSDIVRPEHFAEGVHARIYSAITKLLERGQQASPITLKTVFDQDAALNEIGGAQYLARLIGAVVTIVNAPDYAKTIRDLYVRRQLIEIGRATIEDAHRADLDTDGYALIEAGEQKLQALAEQRVDGGRAYHVAETIDEALQEANTARNRRGEIVGVPTGLIDLDRALTGLHDSDMIVVGGRPSMGKTDLLVTIAMNAARRFAEDHRDLGLPLRSVAIFEAEMSRKQINQRFLAFLTGHSASDQRGGNLVDAQLEDLVDAARELRTWPLLVDDSAAIAVAQIRQRARRLKRSSGRLGLILVDYLQLLTPAPHGRDTRQDVLIGGIAKGLKNVAKELNVPVVLLSQLTRDVEKRDDKRPMMGDLKESGDIEAAADVVLLLYRHEYYLRKQEPIKAAKESEEKFIARQNDWAADCSKNAGLADMIIAKNRHGPTRTVRTRFDGAGSRFENLFGGHQ